jgi:hypothetical protein
LSIEIRKKDKKLSAYRADHDPISGTNHAPGSPKFGGRGYLPLIRAQDTDVAVRKRAGGDL